jgi:hypothetical protein
LLLAAWDGAVHPLEADSGLADRPSSDLLVGGQLEPCAAGSPPPHDGPFEPDLSVWLACLTRTRQARADEKAIRRLLLVYAVGWAAVSGAVLSVPLVGVAAALLAMVLLVGTLVLPLMVTGPGWGEAALCAAGDESLPPWSSLASADRARLVRILNLSRIAERPLAAELLLQELDEALAAEPLVSWRPLRDLREMLLAGPVHIAGFGPELSQRGSQGLFAGHVP